MEISNSRARTLARSLELSIFYSFLFLFFLFLSLPFVGSYGFHLYFVVYPNFLGTKRLCCCIVPGRIMLGIKPQKPSRNYLHQFFSIENSALMGPK
uniref:Uncharacterized protein n=1 Tax=Arundo donax TaxID=35708 RepID=A0A0A9FGZ6_ARUDO